MQILLNGELRQITHGDTPATLLQQLNLSPQKVAVEVNRRLVRSNAYDQPLADGDHVEIVTFVGGGA